MPKAIFVDTSRCTACRGCQAGCKEWKDFPGVPTKQQGTHQNPPDLNPYNVKLVRFSEHLIDGKVAWYFFPDQCRHCLEAPCMMTASNPEAIVRDEATGAVIFTDKIRDEDAEAIRQACPYNIPRKDEKTGLLVKCDMCIDRVQAGKRPMCVQSCAMGAMHFGERAEILSQAKSRLDAVKKEFPKAQLLDADSVSVIYLVLNDPALYHEFAVAQGPSPMNRADFLAGLTKPFRNILG
jgi:formate dehydrogenase iron-sulfur subunit